VRITRDCSSAPATASQRRAEALGWLSDVISGNRRRAETLPTVSAFGRDTCCGEPDPYPPDLQPLAVRSRLIVRASEHTLVELVADLQHGVADGFRFQTRGVFSTAACRRISGEILRTPSRPAGRPGTSYLLVKPLESSCALRKKS